MQTFQSQRSVDPAQFNQKDNQNLEANEKMRASQPGEFTRDRNMSETQQACCDSTSDDTNSQPEEVQPVIDDVNEDLIVGKCFRRLEIDLNPCKTASC